MRYDEQMSDIERAGFDNLILLCNPLHQIVDGTAVDSVDTLGV